MAGQSFEEGLDSYHPNGFHPVHLGDIFHCRYKVLRKLGYGRYSTVLEPMGETLASFGTLFPKGQVPSPIIQRFTKQLLLALDYAHRSGVIHTDIQPRNVMIQISDLSIIASQPLRDFYIPESSNLMDLDVALCDWGAASWTDNHLTEVIQPVLLRAPEVILRAPWGAPVDIWNLGAVLLEVLDAVRMFDGRAAQTGGVYKTKHHLEEMVALFGPFPSWLLAQGKKEVVDEFFDENGRIRDPIPRPEAMLENWIESLAGDDKAEFIMFLKSMMKIDPRDRLMPKQLLDEPWLQHTS
ncbi:hypothetical protein ARAM_002071 [Aspergillus rambellii]|uniref:non-specific serine/threonine protein kinase n=1 Tax=Aspergillus rambellii TaxID=308745 RepID=A0A0F8XPM3_9EURO|nr:hypothetical protein ARAM_002071 [Aspergillus rambellii]